MLRSRFPTAHHFTVTIFGCQYHADSPSVTKLKLINKLEDLIGGAALHVEELEQNDLPSKIWMSYWTSPQSFKAWWQSSSVILFWNALPDDAGFWRETISLPATRTMYESNKEKPSGFGHCGESIPLTEKSGYWGAYRSRLTPDGPDDEFASPLSTVPEPRPLTDNIRYGRVRMTKFPDNLCFVVEGQDYSAMPDEERGYWNKNFDGLAKQWITNVVTGGSSKGMVSPRACHAFAGNKMLGAKREGVNGNHNGTNTSNGIFPGLDYIRQVQILFWLDMSKMEHMGRWDKVHVKLRRDFLTAYGPGGVMEGGDLLLWVDLGILKGDEIDAEYIGCYDGTGFLAYDDHPLFASADASTDGSAADLPAFFDKPIPSKPIEW
ncbi:heme-containing dehydratase protein [Thelonectria olida]|uniref:Heme-containing dehydratase protein n=1 Tax=Thelonectria olida TaxID=1576542 RepID=A0A9P8VXR2_9HYPO|nr:heme-containing dehydratase protein [Thelonectria olida]